MGSGYRHWVRLRSLFDRRRLEAELDDELRFHLEMEAEANVARGMGPEEARRAAYASFGRLDRYREECRDARATRPLEELGRDVRYGARVFRRSPGFAVVAVLTLALGIGAATAVFSLVNSVLLRPLPYAEAERIQTLLEAQPEGGVRTASYPAFEDYRDGATSFAGLAYIRGEDFILRRAEGPKRLAVAFVSPEFFRVMGAEPRLGRVFEAPGAGEDRIVVLSERVWREQFAADRGIVGREVSTPEGPFTVVGVMPAGFQAPFWADAWVPLSALPAAGVFALTQRDLHVDGFVMGRLASGVTPDRAQRELSGIAARLAEAYPDDARGWTRVTLRSLPEDVLGDVGSRLLVLAAAVALVLLVACANVANLLLARASTRTREVAVRMALGAGRARLVRQLLVESAMLAVAGGVLGIGVAAAAIRLVKGTAPQALPRLAEVALDARVLGFSLLLSLVTALLFGLAPALRAARPELTASLRTGTAGAGVGRGAVRLRSALVVAEIALALVLMVGAGLLVRSLWQLQGVSLGFDPEEVVTVRVFPPSPRYDDAAAAAQLYRQLREALEAVPGVREAALVNHVPLSGGSMVTRLAVGGRPPAEDGSDIVLYRTASPEYTRAMGTRVLRGRGLTDADLPAVGSGVVVNETAARLLWPDADPLGQSVTVFRAAQGRPDFGEPITAPVVGVVEGERFFGLAADPPPAVFVPYTWNPWPNIHLVVKAERDAAALIPALRRAVLAVDPDLPVAGPSFQAEFHTLDEYLSGSTASQRLNAALLGAFAATAFFLSVLGVFGVMAYLVVQRTREIGLRMALGARRADVLRMVTRQTLRLAAAGVALGMAGAFAATRLLRSLLFEVSATDPIVFAGGAALFVGAALLAGLLPARRAARVEPMVALRSD